MENAPRSLRRLQLVLGVLLGATASAFAQQNTEQFLEQRRSLDDALRTRASEQRPVETFVDWEWGGWVDYFVFLYDDGVQSQRVLQRPGMSFWTRLRIDQGAHEIFARVRLNFEYFNPGDEYDLQQDWIGPNFDRAFYRVDIGRALRLTGPDDPIQLGATIGRQTVTFGTGYALDLPADAIVADLRLDKFVLTGLFGKTIPSYPNIDRSEPVDTHSARRFFGAQLTYDGFARHRPFAYAFWNDDYQDERPKDPLQNFAYDTAYFGLGSRGSLIRNLNYWTEVVYESGRSYGDGDFRSRDEVDAYAWDVGLEYLFDVYSKPRVIAEYMFASGDAGRIFSPTNAAGGNRGDRRDTSFAGFGYRDTGLALAPVVSNLHIWKAGGSLQPLERVEAFRDLELGSNWFLYHKNKSRAAISDITADEFEGFVGWEMDYFINWRFASDLAWTVRWGVFFPADAYFDADTRHFFFTGVTWSF